MRRGFSLIELVFAIVIIGISVAALPRIVQQSQRSNEFALKQELTLNAKTMMGSILKEPWDSSAYNQECTRVGTDSCPDVADVILPIPIYNIQLGGSANSNRVGIVNMPTSVGRISRSTNFSNPDTNWQPATKAQFKSHSYGANVGGENDIDDYNDKSFNMNPPISAGDFLTSADVRVRVDFVNQTLDADTGGTAGSYRNDSIVAISLDSTDDSVSAATTNIKRIIVTVADAINPEYSVSLTAYSFNVGDTPPPYSKTWSFPAPPAPTTPATGEVTP